MINFLKQLAKVLIGRAAIVGIVPPIEFVGWKMATGTLPPWSKGGSNALAIAFSKCDSELAANVLARKIILTQFRKASVSTEVDQLRWRHYIVYWSATVASRLAGEGKNFVEMGVCDGLTAWYASRARRNSTAVVNFSSTTRGRVCVQIC
jgi:hypothetical protein